MPLALRLLLSIGGPKERNPPSKTLSEKGEVHSTCTSQNKMFKESVLSILYNYTVLITFNYVGDSEVIPRSQSLLALHYVPKLCSLWDCICTECSLVPTWAAMAANGADPNDLVNCHFSAQGLDEIRATNRSTESTDPCCQEEGMTGYDVWVAGIVIWGESASFDVSCESPSRNILQLQRTLF